MSTRVQPSPGDFAAAAVWHGLVLRNGVRVRLRDVVAEDRDGFAKLFSRLSLESRRKRFFGPKPCLTPRELAYFTDVDQVRHAAIAAIDERDGSIVGVGRYVSEPERDEKSADVAVEVVDELQGLGIGTALASRTEQRARANGFASLTAVTSWDNQAARALLRRLRFRAVGSSGTEINHALALEKPGTARATGAASKQQGDAHA